MKDWRYIDWTNPTDQVSDYFTVKEALWCNEWSRLATEKDGLSIMVKFNIVKAADWMDQVREILAVPVKVKSWFRPKAYNALIGGARESMHMDGRAVDFWTDQDGDGTRTGADCDRIKEQLKTHLVKLDVRMEDTGKGARWVHLDDKKVPYGARFFKP